MSTQDPNCDSDSDMNEEFEDIPITTTNGQKTTSTQNSNSNPNRKPQWTPTLTLPPQKPSPIPGSEEETQLRGRISTGIERVTYRQMKSEMGMDAPDTHISHRRYENFAEFATDVDALVDLLWSSASREYTAYSTLAHPSVSPMMVYYQ